MLRFSVVILWVALLFSTVPNLPTQAEETVTVYSQSGRYSLDLPASWASSDMVPNSRSKTFIGETITAADSSEALAAWDGSVAAGSLLIAEIMPVAELNWYGEEADISGKTDEEILALYPQFYYLSWALGDLEYFEVDGYPAARTVWYDDYIFPGYHRVGATVVLADGFFYSMLYTGSDMEPLEAIAETLRVHAEPAIETRPPLTIDDGTLTITTQPGWLVMDWHLPGGPFNTTVFELSASPTQHYLLMPDHAADTLSLVYSYRAMEPTGTTVTDLTGLLIDVGVYPYDALFGSSDIKITDEQRLAGFSKIASDFNAHFDEAIPQTVDGAPALTASLERVITKENRGMLMVIDTNYHFYAILIAAPEDRWEQERLTFVGDLMAAVNVVPSVASAEIPTGIQIGMRAPDFTLTLMDGSTVSLSDYQGKTVVLNFWTTWCEPCREEMPVLQQAHEELNDEVVIFAVNYLGNAAEVETYMQEEGLSFPIGIDSDGTINEMYQIIGYPTNYVIGPDGVIGLIPGWETLTSVNQIKQWQIIAE